MADGNAKPAQAHKSLTLEEVDRIHECAYQAAGIIALIRTAAPNIHAAPDDALPGACWIAERLIEEMQQIATGNGGRNNG